MLKKYFFDDKVVKEKILEAKKRIEKIFSILYEE